MQEYFENVKRNFGFGCMRLPMIDKKVDIEQFKQMVDVFMESGFNYFDTAHGYIDGQSETALREGLTSRYPRESYILTDKLSSNCFKCREDIAPFLDEQLEILGVDYLDFYLMHAQNAELFEFYKKCEAYETVMQLKQQGKIRHMGISFHDKVAVLDQILTEYPQIEVVQIQFNYLDYEDPAVEGRKCYEVCRKHNKPMIIMEPVKGGRLVNLPEEAKEILDSLNGGSPASYAIRFAAGFDGMMMVISGMSDLAQMNDNIGYMQDFKPLQQHEIAALAKVAGILKGENLISCTACRYCVAGCPKQIPIPDIFACRNEKTVFHDLKNEHDYNSITAGQGKASDCIKCGKCEKVCPQHLKIRELLDHTAKIFE